ncbi:hypothetical protein ASD06_10350 [Angustibacter sp. Root456]|nr:hypothetical protein ASD06_10350 [Angustibacter sp. Root456]
MPASASLVDMDDGAGVAALFARQHGLATRAQLYELGLTRAALRWRLGRGWRAVAGPVVSSSTQRLSPRQRVVAAQLLAGPDGVLSGDHAVLLHGLSAGRGHRPVHVLVPMNRDSRSVAFVQVTRTRRPVERPLRDGLLRVAPLPRAVVDTARWASTLDHARAVVIEAVQTRRADLDDLQHELDAGPRRGSALARQAIADARAGAWSAPEAELLDALGASTLLPPVVANPVLTVAGQQLLSPDLWIDDVALALMVHSRRHMRAAPIGSPRWRTTASSRRTA